ncbi:hypothetical protein DYU11_23195 [Fibrisoma montanum]|uniref:TonB C-terminal domain-containing protein n=1 Tax=Fibrisoma montanum TaxID=2305895 RepID=A0A418M2F8_9BACT|nr:hypothetical protein [Fibrisoma montanum]RIV19835.1 hypothetical protein DYU11_23195 [Fibrisoma montanum]
MKILISSLFFALMASSLAWSQVGGSSLNNDSDFRQVLKSVQYPLLAEKPTKEAKVYVDFTIDKEGKISNVKLLKMGVFSQAFVGEVTRLFANLPTQKPAYAGDYVLPVVFEAKPKAGDYQPTASDRAAYDRTFVQLSHSKALLTELYVTSK